MYDRENFRQADPVADLERRNHDDWHERGRSARVTPTRCRGARTVPGRHAIGTRPLANNTS